MKTKEASSTSDEGSSVMEAVSVPTPLRDSSSTLEMDDEDSAVTESADDLTAREEDDEYFDQITVAIKAGRGLALKGSNGTSP